MGYFASLARPSTYAGLTYLILGFPLGLAYFVFLVVSVSLSAGLAIVWIGIPLFMLSVLIWRALATFERRLARGLLGLEVDDPPNPAADKKGIWQKSRAVLTDPTTWRSLVWLAFRFPLGLIGLIISVLTLSLAFGFFVLPLMVVTAADMGGSQIDVGGLSPVFWMLPVIGILIVPALAHVVRGWALFEGQLAKALLGPTARQQRERLQRRTRVLEERTRLAHELHDSVGHTLTMIVVQAGAGRHVFEKDPDFAKAALDHIEQSGRQALTELDRILGILRDEDRPAERIPHARLSQVHELVDRTAATGLPVTLTSQGHFEEVPSDVGRTAYRVVQEGLTNVVKHAGMVATRVAVSATDRLVEVEITNEASSEDRRDSAVSPTGGGRGLAGIRERVGILGGRVEAGPREQGGYRLWAQLPRDGG